MGSKSKRIGTFKEFLHSQKLNENVNIEVDWWDECIVEVLQDLEEECQGFLTMDSLQRYITTKFSILGRKWDEYIDNIYIMHIKDLIFQHHGDSFCLTGESGNAELHSKGVVIEELAAVIYDKFVQKAEPQASSTPTTKLVDREKTTMVPMKPVPVVNDVDYPGEYCEDLPWEYDCENKKVKKFADFCKPVNETVAMVGTDGYNDCIEYCMKTIKKEVGSYDPDAILNKAVEMTDSRVKARLTLLYVKAMVEEYLTKKNRFILADAKGKVKNGQTDDDTFNQGLDILSHKIADDILVLIAKENGVVVGDEEV